MRRKICIVTGSRAEYELLKPLIEEIEDDSNMKLQLVVTGMHLSPEFGLTYQRIEQDGFSIDEKIEILLSSDTPTGISKSIGLAIISFAEAYTRLKPDILVVLGDRFEIFGAVVAAHVSRLSIAHLHGGELSEGSIDDSFRHSITKMSHLHFTSTEEYRKRIIQLGEAPERTFNVGAIGLDNIMNKKFLSKKTLEKKIDFKFNKHNLLITFHPATIENNTSQGQFQNLLDVLDELKTTNLIFTKANADTGSSIINRMIDKYVLKNSHKTIAFTTMGQLKYFSTMQFVDAVVGNSSSGIIEAPSFKIGTINIGDRQKGRIRPKSVINCESTKRGIRDAIRKLYSKEFQKGLKDVVNPYGDGNTAKRVKDILKKYDLSTDLKKYFYDIDFSIT